MSLIDILRLFLPLIVIGLLLYGLLRFVKKFSFNKHKNNLVNVKVISSQMIMPKKFISVVKVSDKLLVLGVADGSISLLKELQADESSLIENPQENTNQGFADIFRKFLHR